MTVACQLVNPHSSVLLSLRSYCLLSLLHLLHQHHLCLSASSHIYYYVTRGERDIIICIYVCLINNICLCIELGVIYTECWIFSNPIFISNATVVPSKQQGDLLSAYNSLFSPLLFLTKLGFKSNDAVFMFLDVLILLQHSVLEYHTYILL